MLRSDGVLRAGRTEVHAPAALLRARAREGTVAVEFDPEVSLENAARFLRHVSEAGVPAVEVRAAARRLLIRRGPPPAGGSGLPRRVPRPETAEVVETVDGVIVVARPDDGRLTVRVLDASRPDERMARARDALERLRGKLRTVPVELAVEMPRLTPWSAVAPIVSAASEAVGDRVVRHELVPLP